MGTRHTHRRATILAAGANQAANTAPGEPCAGVARLLDERPDRSAADENG